MPRAAERARVELPRIMPMGKADVSEAMNGAEHFPSFDRLDIFSTSHFGAWDQPQPPIYFERPRAELTTERR